MHSKNWKRPKSDPSFKKGATSSQRGRLHSRHLNLPSQKNYNLFCIVKFKKRPVARPGKRIKSHPTLPPTGSGCMSVYHGENVKSWLTQIPILSCSLRFLTAHALSSTIKFTTNWVSPHAEYACFCRQETTTHELLVTYYQLGPTIEWSCFVPMPIY
jgi:hypothetical protein